MQERGAAIVRCVINNNDLGATGKTSDVIAVVKTDTGLYSTSKEVKVTIGGCGG